MSKKSIGYDALETLLLAFKLWCFSMCLILLSIVVTDIINSEREANQQIEAVK